MSLRYPLTYLLLTPISVCIQAPLPFQATYLVSIKERKAQNTQPGRAPTSSILGLPAGALSLYLLPCLLESQSPEDRGISIQTEDPDACRGGVEEAGGAGRGQLWDSSDGTILRRTQGPYGGPEAAGEGETGEGRGRGRNGRHVRLVAGCPEERKNVAPVPRHGASTTCVGCHLGHAGGPSGEQQPWLSPKQRHPRETGHESRL